MNPILVVVLAGALLATSTSATMANGQGRRSIKDNGWQASPYCLPMRRSPILDLPSMADMRAAVEERYERALEISSTERVIYSRRPVFPWAVEAKAACGRAIGYFKGREVNVEMISKCDCYHERMSAHLRHR